MYSSNANVCIQKYESWTESWWQAKIHSGSSPWDMDVWNMFSCMLVYVYVLYLRTCACADAMSVQMFACMSRFASYVSLTDSLNLGPKILRHFLTLPIVPKTGGMFHSPSQPRFSPLSTYLIQRSRNNYFVVLWLDFDGIAHILVMQRNWREAAGAQPIGHATESERSKGVTYDTLDQATNTFMQ